MEAKIYIGVFYNYIAQQTQHIHIKSYDEQEALEAFRKYVKRMTGHEVIEEEDYVIEFCIDIDCTNLEREGD